MPFVRSRLGFMGLPLLVGWAVCLSACTAPSRVPVVSAVTEHTVKGKEWVAVAIDGVASVADPKPFMRWTGPQLIGGSAGCNQFRGRAVLEADNLQIGPLGGVGQACMTPPSGQEDKFFKALESTRKVRMEDAQLVLLNEAGNVVLRFDALARK